FDYRQRQRPRQPRAAVRARRRGDRSGLFRHVLARCPRPGRIPGQEEADGLMPPEPTAAPRRTLAGVLFRGALAGLALAAAAHFGYVLVGPNFHTVLPGAVYRCAQPSPSFLERLIRARGVRTVINLRGCSDPTPWYLEQCRVISRLGVSQEDLSF